MVTSRPNDTVTDTKNALPPYRIHGVSATPQTAKAPPTIEVGGAVTCMVLGQSAPASLSTATASMKQTCWWVRPDSRCP